MGWRAKYLIPIAVLAAAFALAITVFAHSLAATDSLFPGFFYYRCGAVSAMQRGPWQGPRAGLTVGDQVVAVEGEPMADGRALAEYLQQRRAGERLRFEFVRGRGREQRFSQSLLLRRLATADIWATFVLPYAIGVMYLLLGAVIFFVKRTYIAALAMSICIVASVFYVTTFDAHTAFGFSRLWITYPLLGPLSFHLFSAFPRRLPRVHRPMVLLPIYGLSAVLVVFTQTTHTDGRYTTISSLLCTSFVAVCFLADIVLLTLTAKSAASATVRNKARTIRIGLLVTIAAAVVWSLVMARVNPKLLTAQTVLGLSALFPVLLAYAVLKKNLFDLDIVIRATVIYAIASTLVAGVYLALVVVLGLAIQTWTQRYVALMDNVEAVAVSTLVAAMLFHPLRLRVQRLIDRTFFREKGLLRHSLGQLERNLAQTERLPDLALQLTERLRELLRCGYVALLAPATEGDAYEVHSVAGADVGLEGLRECNDKLLAAVGARSDSLRPADLSGEPPEVRAALAEASVSLLVRLGGSGTLAGVLLLGPRQQRDTYTRFELEALASLAPTAGLALRYSALLRQHAARERLATLGQLSAVIIHEVKNPLGIIKVASGTLRKRYVSSSNGRELTQFIEDEADRMNRTIAQFLRFARPQPPRLTRFDLSQLLGPTLKAARPELEQANISLRSEISPAVTVYADPDQIQQVLHNLLANAREAIKPQGGGQITVWLAQQGDSITLVVENDGPQIAQQVATHLFEPFVTTRPGGTGLGLAIARQLLREQRGRIEVESADARTAFIITLPRAEVTPTATSPAGALPTGRSAVRSAPRRSPA